MEGHRWYDLVRWGIAAEELNNYIKYESQYLGKYQNKYYNPNWTTLPIPINEIRLMNGLLVLEINKWVNSFKKSSRACDMSGLLFNPQK